MSDGALSQDEIDALLQGTDDSDFDMSHLDEPSVPVGGNGGNGGGTGSFSSSELSLLKNMIVETSSGVEDVLGITVGKKVVINNPRVEAGTSSVISGSLPGQIVEVKMDYEEGVVGEHLYLLSVNIAKELSEAMMGQNGGELTDASLSAVSEAMNVISGNVANKIGAKIGKSL